MVVKVYVSGISGNKEVKKRQQRVLMILDSKSIKYDIIDITEPGKEGDKDFMQNNSKSNGGTVSDPNPRSALPPQLFNDEEYCGDYDLFDLANEMDTLEQFLKMEVPPEEPPQVDSDKEKAVNGDVDVLNESKEETSQIEENTEVTEKTEETTIEKEKSPVKEDSPTKEGTPARDAEVAGSKEGTPLQDETGDAQGDTKEESPDKEIEERQKSVEKENTPEKAQSPEKEVETKQVSKENTPEKGDAVNENGAISSREQSQDKDAIEDEETEAIEQKINPLEALIQSEQVAATE